MSNVVENIRKIKLNWFKFIGGLTLIAGALINYKRDKENKYSKLASVVAGTAGIALLISELETKFKPVEDVDETQE